MGVIRLNFRVLEYFIEVARDENISRAAQRLYVSQPANSKQIQALEDELKHKLFRRNNGRLELTDEGRLFLRRAEDILELVHKTKAEFETLDSEMLGEIHIGAAESDSMKYIARTMKELQKKYPRVRYHLYSGNNEDLFYRLDGGLLDFLITFKTVDIEHYDSVELPTPDVWGVIMRRDSPLAVKRSITVDDLRDKPLICSREAMNDECLQWFGADFKRFNVPITYNLLFNASIMVREGLGYALSLDRLADTRDGSELCFRPLEPQLLSTLRLIRRKERLLSTAASIFFRACLSSAEKIF